MNKAKTKQLKWNKLGECKKNKKNSAEPQALSDVSEIDVVEEDAPIETLTFYTKQMIMLENYLLSFSAQTDDVLVFDLIESEWSRKTTVGHSELLRSSEKSPLCLSNGSTVVSFGGAQTNVDLYLEKPTFFDSLYIDQTQTPWEMYWESKNMRFRGIPYRIAHTASIFKNSLYVYGGKDEDGNVTSELLIISMEMTSYMRVNTSGIKPEGRYNHSSLTHNQKMYIFGGINEKNQYLNDIWMWDFPTNSRWQKIFRLTNLPNGVIPIPRCLSFIQIFENTLYVLKGNQDKICEDFLSYEMDSERWTFLNSTEKLPFDGEPHIFAVYNSSLIIGKDLDLYTLNLFENSEKEASGEVTIYLKQVFDEKLFTDITFKVEGEEVLGHRAILAGRSDYFKKMFTSKMKESESQVIDVRNVKSSVFKALMEFVYYDDVSITEEIALDLLMLADEYLLDKLKTKCESALTKYLQANSVIDIANAADKCEALYLRAAALEFIVNNSKAIHETDKISRLNDSILFDLIKGKS